MTLPARGQTGHHHDERGQTMILILGFAVVLMLLVVAVIDATALFVHRSGLNTIADGAALRGANGVSEDAIYNGGLDESAPLDPVLVNRMVDDYLAQTGAYSRYPGLQCDARVVGESVVVTVSAPLSLPIPYPGHSGTVPVTTDASALTRTFGG